MSTTSWWSAVRSWCLLGVLRARGVLALPLIVAIVSATAPACNTAELKQAPVGPSVEPSGGPLDDDEDRGTSGDPDEGTDRPDVPALAMSRNVTIQVQPSDEGAAVLAAIKGAKKSVYMTMYLLSSNEVIDALGDAKQAGRDVKVVLNENFPPNGGDNSSAFDKLKARGVDVQWAPSAYTFTHAKTIIIDSETLLVMTMNLTFTSAKTNREYIATSTDPDDVAVAEQLFQADFTNKAVKVESKLVVSPTNANALEPREHLTRFIDSARSSLDVEVQTLSDTAIVDAILRAHQEGIEVRVVISGEATVTPAQSAAIDKLKQSGVPIRSLASPDIHAKAIVVDGKYAYIGSHNMTANSLTQNREVGVITDAAAEAAKVRDVIAADFAIGKDL